MLRVVVAVVGGVLLSFAFTVPVPLIVLGEGAVTTQLAAALVLGVAVLIPGFFVGVVLLRRWPEALVVAAITGGATFAFHMLDLNPIDRPMGQPEYWPTFVAPVAAMLASAIVASVHARRDRRLN